MERRVHLGGSSESRLACEVGVGNGKVAKPTLFDCRTKPVLQKAMLAMGWFGESALPLKGGGGQTKVVAARDRASPKRETKMKDVFSIGQGERRQEVPSAIPADLIRIEL